MKQSKDIGEQNEKWKRRTGINGVIQAIKQGITDKSDLLRLGFKLTAIKAAIEEKKIIEINGQLQINSNEHE